METESTPLSLISSATDLPAAAGPIARQDGGKKHRTRAKTCWPPAQRAEFRGGSPAELAAAQANSAAEVIDALVTGGGSSGTCTAKCRWRRM
jgi:hypothetical protein